MEKVNNILKLPKGTMSESDFGIVASNLPFIEKDIKNIVEANDLYKKAIKIYDNNNCPRNNKNIAFDSNMKLINKWIFKASEINKLLT